MKLSKMMARMVQQPMPPKPVPEQPDPLRYKMLGSGQYCSLEMAKEYEKNGYVCEPPSTRGRLRHK